MPTFDARTLLEAIPWSLRSRAMVPGADRVTLLEDGADGVVALVAVRNGKEHEVELDSREGTRPARRGREIVSWCPCTDFRRTATCPHVAALVVHLAVEQGPAWVRNHGAPADRLVAGNAPAFASRPVWEKHLRAVDWLARRIVASEEAQRPANLPPGRAVEIAVAIELEPTARTAAIALGVWGRWLRANGTPGVLRRVPLADLASLAPLVPAGLDPRPFELLLHATHSPVWGADRHTRTADPAILGLILPDLAANGSLRIREGDERPERHLGWSHAGWRFEVLGEHVDGVLRLRPMFANGTRRRDPTEALVATDGLVVFRDEAGPFAASPAGIAWLRRSRVVEVPREDSERAVELAASVIGRASLSLPGELAWPEVTLPAVPRFVVSLDAGRALVRGEARYDSARVPLGAGEPRVVDEVHRRLVIRDLPAERALAARLEEALAPFAGDPGIEGVCQLAPQLAAEGWELCLGEKRLRLASTPSVAVATGIDWFGLEVAVGFGDDLPTLSGEAALALGAGGVVELADGSVGLVARSLSEVLSRLGRLARKAKGGRQLATLDLLLLEDLLADQAALHLDRAAHDARARLASLSTATPLAEPAGFRGALRPYQRAGAGWLLALDEAGVGGCLADDMGLGKTVQVLAFLAARAKRATHPTLVVAPRSLVGTWLAEAERFVPEVPRVDLSGPDRAARERELAPGTLAVTTWGVLRRDIARLGARRFDVVVFDEAQAAKNRDAISAKAARALDAHLRLALTGTPIENHLGELGSIIELTNPGLVGRLDSLALLTGARRGADEEALATLARALRPILLRRRKDEVLTELPPRTEQILLCDLAPAQRRLYTSLLARVRRDVLGRVRQNGVGRSAFHVLEALLRLRQVACHPGLVDPTLAADDSGKLDELLARLGELVEEGHKALVFSQFTSFLDLVESRLERARIGFTRLDGSTRDRDARVARFRDDPSCPVFLVSLKAGGVGLTLTAASYVFLLDPWWNPAVEAQAIDRTHRIGQERPVFAYRLVARDTVEERILKLQAEKRALAEAVLTGTPGPLSGLAAEDLEILLS